MLTSALKFNNATSDRVTVAETSSMIDMASFSVGVLAKITAYRTVDTYVSKRTTGGAGWHLVVDGTSGQFSFGTTFATTNVYIKSVTGTLPLNRWCFLFATTNSASNNNLYIKVEDGPLVKPALANNIAATGARTTDSGIPIIFGNWNANSRSLSGEIAAGFVVPRILDPKELIQWSESLKTIDGALIDFILAQNGAGQVYDRSGNRNHGTITGAIPVNSCIPFVRGDSYLL